jgi:capsular exopolysaccharide synthesis family protein
VLLLILRRWWIVAIAVGVCLVIALVKASMSVPMYSTTSRIYIEQSGGGASALRGGAGPVNLYTEAERLQSTQILIQALSTPGIRDLPTFAGSDSALDVMRDNLSATVGKEDELINVSFLSPWARDSEQITNAVVDAYRLVTSKQTRSRAAVLLSQIQEQKKQGDQEIDAKSKALLDFQSKYGLLPPSSTRANVVEQRLASLQDALMAAQLEALNAKSAYEQMAQTVMTDPAKMEALNRTAAQGSPALSVTTDQAEIRNELYQLEQKQKELGQRYLPNHPLMKAIQAQIDQRNAAYFLAVKHRFQAATQHAQDLQSAVDAQQRQALELRKKELQYSRLQDDLNSARKHTDALEDQIKDVKVQDDVTPIKVNVVEPANASDAVVKSRKALIIFEGLVIGLILGVGLTFADRRFRSADEIQNGLGLSILGTVPHTHGKQSDSIRGRKVHLDPTSEIAEAYRTVRTAVYFGTPDSDARTILLTSPSEGDGKSTLTSNLGIAMAQAGQRTLIVDADFRRPSQGKIFQVDETGGLSAVLMGRRPLAQAIQRSGVKGLDVLVAGPAMPNPAEVLNGERFEALLQELATMYDHVLVDSPPVMPVADARILSAMCDVTVLVLRAEKSSRKAAEHARDGLISVGANLLGTVVNDVPRRKLRYGAFGAYGLSQYGYATVARNSLPAAQEDLLLEPPTPRIEAMTRSRGIK